MLYLMNFRNLLGEDKDNLRGLKTQYFKKASSTLKAGIPGIMHIVNFRIDNDFKSGQSLKHFMKSCRVKNRVSVISCVVLWKIVRRESRLVLD